MSERIIYDFEWDVGKAVNNMAKHGVHFDQAATVFLDPLALTVFDETHSEHEDRWFTLGLDAAGILIAVSHTYHATGSTNARVRVISARVATRRERRFYEEEPR